MKKIDSEMQIKNSYEILRNRRLTHKTWVMTLGGDTRAITAPGQFVNVAIPGKIPAAPHFNMRLLSRTWRDCACSMT